jgi:uncharacterized protein (TIGR02271 family)
MASKRPAVVGVFRDKEQAQRAIAALRQAGFRNSQIGVIAKDKKVAKDLEVDQETYAEEGAAVGTAAGAAVGGLWGLGIAAGLLTPIGPVIAGGTLAAILASAAAGAAAAGLAGFLIGLGIPEDEVRFYEKELKAGRIIVTVKGGQRDSEARRILQQYEGYSAAASPALATNGQRARVAGRATAGDGATHVELREEELNVRKQPVETGQVRVRKEVVTDKRTLQVPVTREEVVVERKRVPGGRAARSRIEEGEEIRIPVREEQVHVEKRPVVKEEVTIGKRRVQDTKEVAATVRKERARIEQQGKVGVRSR